jgi:DNA helicase-2/ATP-dependent DNA helicase PcrA
VIDNIPIGHGIGPKAIEAVGQISQSNETSLLDAFIAVAEKGDLSASRLSNSGKAAVARFGSVYATLRSLLPEVSLLGLLEDLIHLTGYEGAFDPNSEEDLVRKSILDEVKNDVASFEQTLGAELGSREPIPASVSLPLYLDKAALMTQLDNIDGSGTALITLITLHSAKGLEYPVVFIAGVEEGLLPISRAIENEYDDPSQVEEERRLFYVGITRAEKLLYLTYTGMRMSYGRLDSSVPSRFLDALPQEHVKVLAARHTLAASGTGRLLDRARSTTRSFSSPVSAPVRVNPVVPTYNVGQRVFHAQFGEGTVAEVVARNSDQEVAVEFARHGRKRLLASIAPLDLVD